MTIRRAARPATGDDVAPALGRDAAPPIVSIYTPVFTESSDSFDILTRLGEVASFDTVDAEIKEIEGIRVSVATPEALYRLKKGTVRAKDHQDAAALHAST